MHNRIALLFCSLVLIGLAAHSQIAITPYSYYGLGDLFGQASGRSFGMGRVGIGAYDQAGINRHNPASYADLRLTTFELGGFVTYSQQKSDYNSQNLGNAGFSNAQFAFSNRKGFGIVAGLAPYSTLGYEVIARDSVLVDTTMEGFASTYKGSGGLNQLYVGFGVRFLKRVQVGANLAYAFGTSQYEFGTKWDNTNISQGYAERRTTLQGFTPQLGLQYGDTLKFKVKVDRVKEIDQTMKDLDAQLKGIEEERAALEKEGTKIAAWEVSKQATVDELAAQTATLEGSIKTLMANERENSKEIGKLQDELYRVEKKRKALVQEIRTKKKENSDAIARLALRIEKIEQRKQSLAQEKTEVEGGKRESTSTKTQRYLVRVGATLDPGTNLNGTKVVRYTNSGIIDTLSLDTGSVGLPTKLGFGLSISKANKWIVAADFTLQDWSKFDYFGNASELQRSMGVHVGGEWVPELGSSKYMRKVAYRLGGFYNQSYLTLYDQPISEIGVTAGLGLPLGYYNPLGQSYSRINLGVSLSRRGTTEAHLLQEMTVQFRVGVNLNDVWFIKRRID